MAEEITVARPYAEAVYQIATASGTLEKWSDILAFVAAVASDPQMEKIIGNPKLTHADQEKVFFSVCESKLDEQAKNMLRLLLENRRIPLLPAISALFEELKSAHTGTLDATITTAFPLEEGEVRALVEKLVSKFKRQVQPTVNVDPELIGGVRIEVGDVVFDASVRGQLQKMAFTLKR